MLYFAAHGSGDPYLVPGKKLLFTMKVPESVMPTSSGQTYKLVPVEAAYSDDEQEVALAKQHRQV